MLRNANLPDGSSLSKLELSLSGGGGDMTVNGRYLQSPPFMERHPLSAGGSREVREVSRREVSARKPSGLEEGIPARGEFSGGYPMQQPNRSRNAPGRCA